MNDSSAGLGAEHRVLLARALEDAREYRQPDGDCADCEASDGLRADHEGDASLRDAYSWPGTEPGLQPDPAAPGSEPAAGADPSHLYGSPECEAGCGPAAESQHFGWDPDGPGGPADRGQVPVQVPREARERGPDAYRQRAPVAATLPPGTPHADPYLAERGWVARGVYVREPGAERELEAG